MKNNDIVILDRYVESNMGHQGGKIKDKEERKRFFEWIRDLEYENFQLIKPDVVFLFHMPHLVSAELKKQKIRKSEFHSGNEDGHESNIEHLKNAEEAYLHMAELFGFIKIECAPGGTIDSLRKPEDIFQEFYGKLKGILSLC